MYNRINTVKKYFKSLLSIIRSFTETEGLHATESIKMLQDQAQCILGDYTKSCYQRQPGRSGTLMHVVGRLTSIFPKLVERLFFHETIGEIPISRLLVDMYQMKGHTNWDLSINGKKIVSKFPVDF